MAQKRNVIVLGKTGSGKSTVGNRLLGTKEFVTSDKPSSVTSTASAKTKEVQVNGKVYSITVIDTVGLFDTGKLSNKDVMKDTKEEIKKHVKGLHLVLFVLRDGRFTDEEKKTFQFIHENFYSDIDPLSLLVITGCEGKEKDDIKREYERNEVTKELIQHMKKGVLPVGFPDLTQYSGRYRDLLASDVKDDEIKLQKLACACETMHLESQLKSSSWCTIL